MDTGLMFPQVSWSENSQSQKQEFLTGSLELFSAYFLQVIIEIFTLIMLYPYTFEVS